MNSKDYRNLQEAYLEVYNPQEITEEQVWEGVEYWVHSLLEEGYDLSDYTWEELYEEYITEILGMPGAQNAGAKVRELGGAIIKKGVSNVGNLAKGAADVAGAYGQGFAGQKTTSSNPLSKGYNAASRIMSAPARAAASFGAGVLGLGSKSDGGKVKSTPTAQKPKFGTTTPKGSSVTSTGVSGLSAADRAAYSGGGGNAAAQRGMGQTTAQVIAQGKKNIDRFDGGPRQGNPNIVGTKPVGAGGSGSGGSGSGGSGSGGSGSGGSGGSGSGTTAPRPAASSATGPKTTSTAPTKPAGSAMDQFAKANPKLAAAQAEKDRIRGTSQTDNPLMKDMKDRMPMTPSVQSPTLAKDLGTGSGNQSLLDNPNASKAATPKKPIVSGFDMFDVVKGYLIGEGYADTEEAALVIMANMSEDWKESILSESLSIDRRIRFREIDKKRRREGKPFLPLGDTSKQQFDTTSFGKGNKATRRQGYNVDDTSKYEPRSDHISNRGVKRKKSGNLNPNDYKN